MLKDYPPLLLKSNELIEAWRTTLQAFDRFTEQSIKGCFFHIKMKVMLRILHHLSEENKLSKYDERIFEYFQHLTEYYQMTLSLFNDHEEDIKTGKAKEILSGICTVLSSQLKQFRESQMVDQGIGDSDNANPIKIEKDKFLTEQKINILNQLDEIEENWMKSRCSEVIVACRESMLDLLKDEEVKYEFIQRIYSVLIQDLKGSLYQCYSNKSEKGTAKLNDFHLRKAANFYYESIKQEKENISAIIKIQVNALEEEMKIENYEDNEQQIIQEILHTIREAYQYLGKEIEELEQFFKDAEKEPNKINLYSEEEFEIYLKTQGMDIYINDLKVRKKLNFEVLEPDEFYNSYKVFNTNWLELKNESLETFTDEINQEELLQQVNGALKKSNEMTQKIIQLFEEFYKKSEEQKENLPDAEYVPIIEGISETIGIKIESLKESSQAFLNTMDEVQEKILEELELSLLEKEYNKINLNIYDQFIKETITNYPLEDSDSIEWGENILDKEINEGLEVFLKRIVRKYQTIKDNTNKKIIRFLREHLLFELSTYEEIIFYSVSKLREEQEEFAVSYVKDIDLLTKALEEVLKEYEIEFIQPAPHEHFNGKEHEVLMAEVKEGFEKGEIIKTMNRGYRYNGQIVLKANVIAGK